MLDMRTPHDGSVGESTCKQQQILPAQSSRQTTGNATKTAQQARQSKNTNNKASVYTSIWRPSVSHSIKLLPTDQSRGLRQHHLIEIGVSSSSGADVALMLPSNVGLVCSDWARLTKNKNTTCIMENLRMHRLDSY